MCQRDAVAKIRYLAGTVLIMFLMRILFNKHITKDEVTVNENLLKPAEVAELLQVQKSTVYKWAHYNYIPHVKLGRSLRFRKKVIDRWVKKKERERRVESLDMEGLDIHV